MTKSFLSGRWRTKRSSTGLSLSFGCFVDRTIVVVGRTGAGKSEFIKRVITDGRDRPDESRKTPQVSGGMQSCTKSFETYMVSEPIGSATYDLVDTKGLMDTFDNDKDTLEQLADLTQKIPTVVGFVYVLPGRMEPEEVKLIDFLLTSFFDNVPASKLLILKSKCTNWSDFDVAREKEQLQGEGTIPSTMLEANWQAVDFHPLTPPQDIALMVQGAREVFATWIASLPIQGIYVTYIKTIQNIRLREDALDRRKREIEERLEDLLEGPSQGSEEDQKKIESSQNENQDQDDTMDDVISRIKEQHKEELDRMRQAHKEALTRMSEEHRKELKEEYKAACSDIMKQLLADINARKKSFCSIM